MTDVILTWYEVHMAGMVGFNRRLKMMARGRATPSWGGESWGADIEAACAEMALAKHLDVYWDGSVDTFKTKGDVGVLEIRSARNKTDSLIVRPRDNPEAHYILMIGSAPTFRIAGGLKGVDAQQPEWLHPAGLDGKPEAWFVPQDALEPV